jgi:hypothetical protein
MKVGTKSVLFGAHCFFMHPFFVATAWTKLYGFPLDPRIWIAFFVHDLGYFGKPNMDGPEGETHVEFGAKIMHFFDGWEYINETYKDRDTEFTNRRKFLRSGWEICDVLNFSETGSNIIYKKRKTTWQDFSLYHSRYYAKKNKAQPSKLCFADKLSFCCTPRWLYLPMVNATGEIKEYLKMAKKSETAHWKPVEGQRVWHNQLCEYMTKWVDEHRDGRTDTWTNSNRHVITDSGVTS